MDWYWYLIIAVAVLGLGAIKLLVFNKYKTKKSKKDNHFDDD